MFNAKWKKRFNWQCEPEQYSIAVIGGFTLDSCLAVFSGAQPDVEK